MYSFKNGGVASKLNPAGTDFIDCPLKYDDLAPTVGKLRQPDKAAIMFVRQKIYSLIRHALNGYAPNYSDKLSRVLDVHSEGHTEAYKLDVTVDGKVINLGFVWQYAEILNFTTSPDSEILNLIVPLLKIAGLDVQRESL